MVSVFSRTDQVVTHLLLFLSVSSVLGTIGLKGGKNRAQTLLYIYGFTTSLLQCHLGLFNLNKERNNI